MTSTTGLRETLERFILEIEPKAQVVTPSKTQKIARRLRSEMVERLRAMLDAPSPNDSGEQVSEAMVEAALNAQPHNAPVRWFLNPNKHLSEEGVRELMRAALEAALSAFMAGPVPEGKPRQSLPAQNGRYVAEEGVPEYVITAFEERYGALFDVSPFDGEWGNTDRYKHPHIQSTWAGWRDGWLTLATAPTPALPEAKPVAWVVRLLYDKARNHWSGDMLTDVLPSDADTYKIVHPLYASPVQVERAEAKPVASPAEGEAHPDALAVDRFAVAMKAKLKWEREVRGRGGWQSMSAAHLSHVLYRHLPKGDPIDVANLAMMLHQNGQQISPASPDREAATREAVIEECAKAIEDHAELVSMIGKSACHSEILAGAAKLRALAQQAKPQQGKP